MSPRRLLRNVVTGEQVAVVRASEALLELETTWTRPGHRAAEHVHPALEERFEVLSGLAAFRVAGEERIAEPGAEVVVPPGTPHVAWNAADGVSRLRLEFRPAGRWLEVVERLFTLAAAGRTDERGVPSRAELIALLREFPDELALPR